MCRLFAFRSVVPSQVHRSLVEAEGALGSLSTEHRDGWGVAFYAEEAPHLTRSTRQALGDQLFHRLSGVVSSHTVLAHVRKATMGEVTVLNCHPFQYGRWTFAHNGDLRHFGERRGALLSEVAPRLRRFILGETDSEVFFHVFLTRLQQRAPLSARFSVEETGEALQEAVDIVRRICDPGAERPSVLTAIATDGQTMVAHRGGRELYWSTYKRRCPDRDACAFFRPACEAPSPDGIVNHLLLSSEPVQGAAVWLPLEEHGSIGVDWRMRPWRAQRTDETLRHAPSADPTGATS